MRAIAYFQTNSGQEYLQAFEEAFLDYCDRNLHQPIKTFADINDDEGIDRFTQYRALIEYMRESGSNFLVVIPDASHIGSDLESVARSMVEFEGIGAKVICDDDDFPDPLQNSFQSLGIKGVSRTRSERIKESMRNRALQGRGLGKPPFGYRIGAEGTLGVVHEEAPIIELIYKLYTKDEIGLRLIAQHLNEREIPTRRGGKWNMVTIRDILRNSAYMGTYTRFGLRLPKSHEAIIPPDVFRAAQDASSARRPRGRVVNAEPFMLSGLVFCGYCDNKMMGVTRRQSWKKKDGRRSRGVYRYYQCQSRNNQGLCEYHTWRASRLEGAVLGQLKYALQVRSVDSLDSDSASEAQKNETRDIWDARVKNAERRFLQGMRRTARAELTIDVLGEYLDDLDNVRRGAANAERPVDVTKTLENWDSLDIVLQQSFLSEHIARIVVKDDVVELAV